MNATNIPTRIAVKIQTVHTFPQFVFEEYTIQENKRLESKNEIKTNITEGKNTSAFAFIKVLIVSFNIL